jgi:hypothetical protein
MKNIFTVLVAVASLLFCSVACSSSSSAEEDEVLLTYRFKVRGDLGGRLEGICSNPDLVGIDLSRIKMADGDLDVLFEALVTREQLLGTTPHHAISLIDLRSGDVTEEGFLGFLKKLEDGKRLSTGSKIYPDVRKTILRIGLGLRKEFIEAMQHIAPSVFAGGIEIVQ